MKSISFKKILPFAAVLIAGTSGAFMTTSMQSAKTKAIPITGYANSNNGPCTQAVQCDTDFNTQVCRVSYPNGAEAKHPDNCLDVLYRPSN